MDQDVCDGGEVTLTGSGAGIGGVYTWDGGVIDGVAFIPADTDTYTVTGTDANGCVNSDEVTVNVLALPPVEAGADVAICDGDWVTLEGEGAGPDGTYEWTGGGIDGVAFAPADTDMYWVTGTDDDGCVNYDSVTVVVNPLPIIDAGDDEEICQDEMVTLSATGAGPDGVYEWTGGVTDGVPFSPDMTETYTVTGTDENGCVNTDDVMVTVHDLPVIEAGLDHDLCIGETTVLNGSGAGVGGVYSWTGGIEDGVVFTPAATYTYIVTGTDENGCVNSDDVTVTVIPLPDIDAGADQEICEGEMVTLSATGAGVGGLYVWSDGISDGVSFTPTGTNVYTVTGTTVDGCINSDDVTVTVHPLPVIAFSGDVLSGCAPLQVNFEAYTEGTTFDWEFGDGSIGAGATTTHVFTTSGLYDVTLTMTSVEGCVNTETYPSYIDVVETPIAQFSFAPYEIDVTDTKVEFFNSSMYSDAYEWSFGDGSGTDTEENPTHIYPPEGNRNYNVTLTATNDYGCVDVAEQLLRIEDVILYYIPNTFTPDGDTFNEEFKPQFIAGLDVYDYHLMIFNRWGELVFESYNVEYGWNGSFGDMGLVEDGVYIYKIEFGDTMSDERHYVNGHITVLK